MGTTLDNILPGKTAAVAERNPVLAKRHLIRRQIRDVSSQTQEQSCTSDHFFTILMSRYVEKKPLHT